MTHSLMPDACETFCHALHISNLQHAQRLLLLKQMMDGLCLH